MRPVTTTNRYDEDSRASLYDGEQKHTYFFYFKGACMKKVAVSLLVIGVIGAGMVLMLMNNKAKMQAKTKTDIITAYPVSVVSVDERALSQSLSLVGTIAASREVAVVAETQGRVTNLNFDMGDYKPAGSVLIQVDDELKEANFKMAEANFEKAKKDLERYEALSREKTITDVQLESVKLAYKNAETQLVIARRQYKDTRVTTPVGGTITIRNVELGSMIQPGTVIANIVDISTLKVKLNVPEQDVFKLKKGEKVEITTDVYPEASFTGTIDNISDKADDAHTYAVEISLPNNRENPLRAGMFGRVNFASVQRDNALVIPRVALLGSIKKPQVFVVQDGKAVLRDLVIGAETGTDIEVLQGLSKGETIVVNGQNNLQSDVPVSVVK